MKDSTVSLSSNYKLISALVLMIMKDIGRIVIENEHGTKHP